MLAGQSVAANENGAIRAGSAPLTSDKRQSRAQSGEFVDRIAKMRRIAHRDLRRSLNQLHRPLRLQIKGFLNTRINGVARLGRDNAVADAPMEEIELISTSATCFLCLSHRQSSLKTAQTPLFYG